VYTGFRWGNLRERDYLEHTGVNIKVDHQDVVCGSMDWFDPAQDRDKWWALVNAVMNFRDL